MSTIAPLVALFGIASLALFIWALIDVIQTDFKDSTMKIVWVIVIVFLTLVGPLLWLVWGRSNAARA